jgi:uncharacterized protein DUF6929
MLQLELLAELDISAASGIVAFERQLCVIADDELFLALYDLRGRPERRIALFEGALPEEHAARKRAKPDLEAMCLLPDRSLLCLGSGSTPGRERGALVTLGRETSVRELDLAPLYTELRERIPELNIEGVAVHDDALWLAQRGNGAAGQNACIELDLALAFDALAPSGALSRAALRAVHAIELPALAGSALGLTDLAPDPRGLLFSAAAEASGNTYDDGECGGSVLGLLAWNGRTFELAACEEVAPRCKLEGVTALTPRAASRATDPIELLVVADPDDRKQRAPLFAATLSA